MAERDLARDQGFAGKSDRPDETGTSARTDRDTRWEGIQDELAGRIGALEALLADAATAAGSLRELLEPIGSLSRFIQELETSLQDVRDAFGTPQSPSSEPQVISIRRSARKAPAAVAEEAAEEEEEVGPEPEPPAAAEEEPVSSEPGPSVTATDEQPLAEEEPSPEPGPSVAAGWETPATEEEVSTESPLPSEPGPGRSVLLHFESSEGYLDLMTVDRVLREDPKIVDLELAEYGGKQATIKVWLAGDGGGEVTDEMVDGSVQQMLARLREHSSGVSIDIAEDRVED